MPALLYEKRDGVAYLTFNRPEVHNAMDPETVVRLGEAWLDFEADNETRVAIITGAGEKAFCAGADLGRLIPLYTRARQPEATLPVEEAGSPRAVQGPGFDRRRCERGVV